MKKPVILLGLNELNFEYIRYYSDKGFLPNFKELLDNNQVVETKSESEYQLLEPWIQWVSIYTGQKYAEHKVFRLGDTTNRKDLKYFFEELEEEGYKIGTVSPFNAANKLNKPAFFIPDPWTKTKVSGPKRVKDLSDAISQLVNDNAQAKISKKSILTLIKSFLSIVKISDYFSYLKLVSQIKSKVGVRAVFLDKLLADVFLFLLNKKNIDFGYLFLNTGAHFQHHYLFNSEAYKGDTKNPEWYCPKNQDPLLFILKEYDKIIEKISKKSSRIIIATGLHQQPHPTETFYWRLKTHQEFLDKFSLKGVKKVTPRMSRDFLIEFNSSSEAAIGQTVLENISMVKNNKPVFTVDNRGDSIFVELTYSEEILKTDQVQNKDKSVTVDIYNQVAFVAIKNGQHNGIGYLLDSGLKNVKRKDVDITEVAEIIKNAVHQELPK